MVKYLEDLLFEKTKDSQSKILFARWNYDKVVFPSALNAVSSLFPHYSLHDESHSITIINNIVRIVGKENIAKLSAIDIWLILEASYNHDIGMVVSSENLSNSLREPDFLNFFKGLINDKKNGLYEFANLFEIIENKITYKSNFLDLKIHDGIKFILAEFFRRTHADRSEEIINNPSNELSIQSPRGIIPKRIDNILAKICASHTKNFSDVLSLPFKEVGIDFEDAHPRYVACLLRIGDLLDLDNNRFSDVMLRTLSEIPIDTLNHKSKHLSIESFRVDQKQIEVIAKCNDYDTASITQHWFNYLNSEISQQMINWNEIVPSKDFGFLPTIGKLNVELLEYEYIDGKETPRFKVDTDKALELIKGAGLYENKYQSIREILQNSVDSTLIRFWLENSSKPYFETPQSGYFLENIARFPITIEITEEDLENKPDKKTKNIRIEIKDEGVGISKSDLNYLMSAGSSSKNYNRTNIIESMPSWLRPSGIFGIGFQSIFLLTDLVEIETKSYSNEEFQIIKLYNPNSRMNGQIFIKREKTNHSIKPGSKISFVYSFQALPYRYSVSLSHKFALRKVKSYDPFTSKSMDLEVGEIIDAILDFSNKSIIPIKLFHNKNEILLKSYDKSFKYFDKENSLEFNILETGLKNDFTTTIYYKNQKVNFPWSTKFLQLEINLHKDKASQVLKINRNEINPEYSESLKTQVIESVGRILKSEFETIFPSDEEKIVGSVFLNYYTDEISLSEAEKRKFNHWENLELEVNEKPIRLKKIIDKMESLTISYNREDKKHNGDLFTLKENSLKLTIPNLVNHTSTAFFISKAIEQFSSIKSKHMHDDKLREITLDNNRQSDPIEISDVAWIIKEMKTGFYSSRLIIPCLEKYFKLRLKDDAFIPFVNKIQIDRYIYFSFPRMLSPYSSIHKEDSSISVEPVLNDNFYNWVYENRFEKQTTVEEIKKTYTTFIEDFSKDKSDN